MMPKIYLIDRNATMTREWELAFAGTGVNVQNIDFKSFMDSYKDDIDGIVSPANSFGLMDGGYDLAISNYFGESLYPAVQKRIYEEYLGEQPVGSCLLIDIPGEKQKLLHTPTMRLPEIINDPRVIYSCMRSALVTAKNHEIKSMVVPAFGGKTGKVPENIIARMMRLAFDDVEERSESMQYNTWGNVRMIS